MECALAVLAPALIGTFTRRRFKKRLKNIAHTIMIKLQDCRDLNLVDRTADGGGELFVVFNTIRSNTNTCLSMARSNPIPKDLNVRFDENLQVCMKGDGKFTVTVIETDLDGNNYLIGQVVLSLGDVPQLYENTVVPLTCDLQEASMTVHGIEGDLFQSNNFANRGHINLSLHIPSIFGNICGWFWDLEPEEPIKIWVCLIHQRLYFDSRSLDCAMITGVYEIEIDDPVFANGGIRIQTSTGADNLLWGWCEDSAKIKGMWHRAVLDRSKLKSIVKSVESMDEARVLYPKNKLAQNESGAPKLLDETLSSRVRSLTRTN